MYILVCECLRARDALIVLWTILPIDLNHIINIYANTKWAVHRTPILEIVFVCHAVTAADRI